ncbi:MAG: capsid protein [Rhodobacteraceae bacterium]|nr:capsid protein [Paracoccaceae bacterium]
MANGLITPSRLGQSGGAGDTDALFLKVFANEVLTTFEEVNVMKDLHTVRTISSGKSAQFPTMGKATAKYHTPGEDVFETNNGTEYVSTINHKERIINIDDVLIAATSIANIDELKNHYDVRSAYSTELGRALAKRFDLATMRTLVAASQVDAAGRANPDAGQGIKIDLGTTTGAPADLSSAANLIQTFRLIAQKLDEQDIPAEDRFVILTPELYYLLAGSDNAAINRDFGGGGSIAAGKVMELVGLQIFSSTHLSDITTNDTTADDTNAKNNPFDDADGASAGKGYLDAGLDTLKFVAGHKSSIGTVKLMDLAVESEYSIPKQATLMLAKYAMGHGILRPEGAVSVVA